MQSSPKPSDDIGPVPKSLEELHSDPLIRHYDIKNIKAKEILIFMEENKIWQDLLADCIERSGVNASLACRKLQDIANERTVYYNSRFNEATRPALTPGVPSLFESRPKAEPKEESK